MKLTDVVDRINGNVDRFTTELEYYIGGEHFESNELEVTQKGLLKENLGKLGFKFHFAFQDRDVVFMARNPHLRKAGMVRFAGLCSDASYILRSKDETVLSQEYLAVMLQSDHFWDYCESHKVGSVNFANNWSSIANYEFELPTPEEQKEISDKVWAAYRVKKSYKKLLAATEEMVNGLAAELKCRCCDVPTRLEALQCELKAAQKKAEELAAEIAKAQVSNVADQIKDANGVPVLVQKVNADSVDALRNLGDQMRDKVGGVVVLAAVMGEKVSILTMATKDAVAKGVHAGNIVKAVAKLCGGGGGGRPDMAQAGAKDVAKVDEALAAAFDIVAAMVK